MYNSPKIQMVQDTKKIPYRFAKAQSTYKNMGKEM
jgi:hypothetical protein